ncbi:hypothetical protein ACFS07_01200 [Undibacterium arcticum]
MPKGKLRYCAFFISGAGFSRPTPSTQGDRVEIRVHIIDAAG